MRTMPSAEMVSLISFLAVLLVFFSIDVRSRDSGAPGPWHTRLFEWASRIGGISTALALTLGWVDLFLPDENDLIHVAFVAVPGSIAVTCAIVLGLEMLWQRWDAP
ncbi:hypothetical protein G6W61_08120 [Streptomyces sp. KAI-26]|nr:hypothetical protein CVT27_01340 [Streptomyces cavourensis]MBT3078067.1 hypothetical protein [Streptomyces sp. COG21]MBT3084911.1 hypothetical protein [Streptomyces sp. COG20]MBT3087052.1 hypothetical protein [Streptomyces sp. CYG21]MBT3097223.1 hypothetical protein [Streptomyces sp. CBG30]MBT3103141.1 hypothetical protein [Streptomyces sp. COG19]MBT3113446.1 hypothetical protein [Streptomyces sp. CYG20]MYR38102.1 hypothetical protein [Streptomyces sp. SID4944]MYT93360.1 hypothetical pro